MHGAGRWRRMVRVTSEAFTCPAQRKSRLHSCQVDDSKTSRTANKQPSVIHNQNCLMTANSIIYIFIAARSALNCRDFF